MENSRKHLFIYYKTLKRVGLIYELQIFLLQQSQLAADKSFVGATFQLCICYLLSAFKVITLQHNKTGGLKSAVLVTPEAIKDSSREKVCIIYTGCNNCICFLRLLKQSPYIYSALTPLQLLHVTFSFARPCQNEESLFPKSVAISLTKFWQSPTESNQISEIKICNFHEHVCAKVPTMLNLKFRLE